MPVSVRKAHSGLLGSNEQQRLELVQLHVGPEATVVDVLGQLGLQMGDFGVAVVSRSGCIAGKVVRQAVQVIHGSDGCGGTVSKQIENVTPGLLIRDQAPFELWTNLHPFGGDEHRDRMQAAAP